MKTYQGTGYFRQVQLRLLLCFISSVVFAASAYAFTPPNNITACYDCHGSPIIPNGTDIRPVDSTYRNITTGGFVGSHRKHIAAPTTDPNACTPCHGAAPATLNHRDGKIEMTLTNPGTYSKGTFFNQTSLPVLGTCSNIACHSATTTPASTPTWGTSAGCAACHASTPATGAHTTHLTAPIPATCGTCHTGATVDVTGGPGHGNNLIDVSLYSPTTVAKHAPGVYTATCSTACHNVYNTTAVTTPSWGVVSTCATCHAASPATGDHTKHLATPVSAACGTCHTGATAGVSGGNGHGNGTINVAQGYPANVTRHAAGTYASNSTCTTTCHNAYSTTVGIATPTWGMVAATCSSCHAASPTTGSHTKHLAGLATNFNRNAQCNDCHIGATAGTTGGAGHGDGNIDVSQGYPASVAKHAAGSGYSACSTAYCHSNGAAGYKSATWGALNAAGCNFCHDALPTTGSHNIHIAGGANYSFGCAECHGHNGTGSAHNDGVLNIIGTIGYNGSKQCTTSDCHSNGKAVGLAYTTSPAWGGTFTGDRCAGCHGNWPTGDAHAAHVVGIHYDDVYNRTGGKIAPSATVASGTNAGHGNALYSTTISCNMCHNTVVTVGYNDNSPSCNTAGTCHASGGSGGLKGSLTTASLSKTLHVNRSRDVSFAAATIRSKAQLRDDITTVPELNNFWTRTNAYKAGASSHDASKATLLATAGYASGTCSAVVCHNGNTVSWTDGAISCDKCHTALP